MPVAHTSSPELLSGLLIPVLALSIWFDVREQRIPNWLTVGGLLSALLLRGLMGWEALLSGATGAGVGLVIGLLLFAAGALGAGDGKLLATVGALLGFDLFLRGLPLIGAFGGVLALAITFRSETWLATFLRFRELLVWAVSLGRLGSRRTLSMPGAVSVPYGVAVAAGAAVAWLGWGLQP